MPTATCPLTTRCEKKYLETRDLGASLAIELTNVLARARRWAGAATKYLV